MLLNYESFLFKMAFSLVLNTDVNIRRSFQVCVLRVSVIEKYNLPIDIRFFLFRVHSFRFTHDWLNGCGLHQ